MNSSYPPPKSLVLQLRDLGCVPRLNAEGKLMITDLDRLEPDIVAMLKDRRQLILDELRVERERISALILVAQSAHDRWPDQAKAFGVALRRWQEGELVDRAEIWKLGHDLHRAIEGNAPLEGEALAREMESVFPGRYPQRVSFNLPAADLHLDAFDPAPPEQESLSL